MSLGVYVKDSKRSGIRRTHGKKKKLVGVEMSIEERGVVAYGLGSTTNWISFKVDVRYRRCNL
jgi:hypothetical protein